MSPLASFDLPDEIEADGLRAAVSGELQLAAGDLDFHGHEVAVAGQAEIIDFGGDGKIGDGVAQHQGFGELAFLVLGVELLKQLAGEVTVAVFQLGGEVLLDLEVDFAIVASSIWASRCCSSEKRLWMSVSRSN